MSRGFGSRQRRILETLERYPEGFYLASLTADNVTENKSFNRAAFSLQKRGRIRLVKYNMGMKHAHCCDKGYNGVKLGGPRVVVIRPNMAQVTLDRVELERVF